MNKKCMYTHLKTVNDIRIHQNENKKYLQSKECIFRNIQNRKTVLYLHCMDCENISHLSVNYIHITYIMHIIRKNSSKNCTSSELWAGKRKFIFSRQKEDVLRLSL